MGRTGTGATLATLPLTGAAIAAASDESGLMWALIAVSGAVMLGTIANRLPWLHRMPLIGAPKPLVTFKVNGSSSLVVRLATPPPGMRPDPRTAQIEVGVRNPSSFERIDRALINFILPVGLRRKATDASGNATTREGVWAPPTLEPIGSHKGPFDYWCEDHVDYATGSSTLMYFEVTFAEEGDYAIRLRMSAPALYEKDYDIDGVLRIDLAEDGPVEKVTDVIAQGVALRGRLHEMEERQQRIALMDFMAAARFVVDAEYPAGAPLLSATTAFDGPRVGAEYYEALLRDDVAALYLIRTRLGEAEDAM